MHKSACLVLRVLSLIGVICAGCSETPGTGTLELVVVDGNETEVPCRVLVRPLGGDCLLPGGATELAIGPDRWFMAAGRVRLPVPAGKVEIRVERGLEYVVYPKNSIQPVRKHKAQAQVANLNDLPRRALRTTMRISGQAFALRLKRPPGRPCLSQTDVEGMSRL